MNSSAINSSRPFYHSSAGSSLKPSNEFSGCVQSDVGYVFQFTAKFINLGVGYPANIMLMWLVARQKSDSSTSDIFILNLAITDDFFSLMAPINIVGVILVTLKFLDVLSFAHGIKNSSPLFLTCICLDRYVAVVHPLVYTSIKDNNIRVAISMLVWGLMIAYAACRSLDMGVSHHVFVGQILAIFIIIVYCNIFIMWNLRKLVLGKEKINPMKKKALRTVQIYLGIIVFHYLPIAAVMPIRYRPLPEFCQMEFFALALMHLSSITQPLLYISLIKQLPWLKKLLCICCQSPSPEPHNVST